MLSRLEVFLTRWARWPVMLGLAVLSVLFMGVVFPLFSPANNNNAATALDTRLWYTAAEVQTHMQALSPEERSVAALSHLTADVVYPAVYGALLAMLLLKTWPGSHSWQLALATVAADLMENVSLALLYWTYPRTLKNLTPLAAGWTALKWALVALVFVLILVGALNRWRKR